MCGGGCSHHRTGLSLQSFVANEVNDSGLFELDPQRNRKRRALALADNRIAESAGWDRDLLAIELPELAEMLVVEGLDVSITGFSPVEIDQLTVDFEEDPSDPDDTIDPEWTTAAPVSKPGDLSELGSHLLPWDARSLRASGVADVPRPRAAASSPRHVAIPSK